MPLLRFHFVITYWPNNQQQKINALSYHFYLAPKEGNVIYDLQKSINFELECLAIHSLINIPPKDSPIIEEIKKTLEQDLLLKKFKRQINEGK